MAQMMGWMRWLALAIMLIVGACAQPSNGPVATPVATSVATPAGELPLKLPPGFQATLFAQGLAGPRLITFAPNGRLLVAERGKGAIVALGDPEHTGVATARMVIADGLDDPTSVVYDQGALFVGERSRITRLDVGPDLQVLSRQVIIPDVPTGGSHTTRTVLIGPDGKLYLAIGSSCNECRETEPRRATVMQFQRDGSGGRIFMTGLRNAVGLASNPITHQVWATDNGRDGLGDDTPPDTIYALQDGANAGWPFCHAGSIIDPTLGQPGACAGVAQPLTLMQAHSAPLGLAFDLAPHLPAAWRGLFVAFHGSWNRTVPTGYKVIFLPLNAQGQIAGPAQDFATGWLMGTQVVGRPVGLAVGLDGALYVSDDQGGTIYRITYRG